MVLFIYRRLERFMLIILFMNYKENVIICYSRERRLIKYFKIIFSKIVVEFYSKGRFVLYGNYFI